MDKKMTIELADEELDKISEKMENGGLSFEETIQCYREAVELLEFGYNTLKKANLEIIELQKRLEALHITEDNSDD